MREDASRGNGRVSRRRALLVGGVVGATGFLAASEVSGRSTAPDVPDVMLSGPGIDPTGVRDSSQAIQAAIDSLPNGGLLSLPPGTYLLASPLALRSRQTLTGPGATLRASSELRSTPLITGTPAGGHVTPDGVVTPATSDITIRDLAIDGNASARRLVNDPQAHIIALSFAKQAQVINCRVSNSAGAGIALYNCLDCTVDRNVVTDSSGNGILVMQASKGTRITGNTVDRTKHQNGIFVMAQDGFASTDSIITENVIRDAGDFAIEVGDIVSPTAAQHANVVVARNTTTRAVNNGIGIRTVTGATISENVILDCGNDSTFFGSGGILAIGDKQACRNVTIRGNVVSASRPTGTAHGIFASGVFGLSISGNTISDVNGNGIDVNGSATSATTDYPHARRAFRNVQIYGNEVTNVQSNGIAVQHAVGCRSIAVSHNTVSGSGAAGVLVSSTGGDNTGVRITDNGIDSPAHQGIAVSGWRDAIVNNNLVRYFGEEGEDDDQRCAILLASTSDVLMVGNRVTPGTVIGWSFGIHDSSRIRAYADYSISGVREYNNSDIIISRDA